MALLPTIDIPHAEGQIIPRAAQLFRHASAIGPDPAYGKASAVAAAALCARRDDH